MKHSGLWQLDVFMINNINITVASSTCYTMFGITDTSDSEQLLRDFRRQKERHSSTVQEEREKDISQKLWKTSTLMPTVRTAFRAQKFYITFIILIQKNLI